MAEVDCALIHGEEVLASRVFGRGAARGLLDWLGEDGTLLINNVELVGACKNSIQRSSC
jgi:hypothetical protein